eukprot:3532881-Rhodomonas_salina.1
MEHAGAIGATHRPAAASVAPVHSPPARTLSDTLSRIHSRTAHSRRRSTRARAMLADLHSTIAELAQQALPHSIIAEMA